MRDGADVWHKGEHAISHILAPWSRFWSTLDSIFLASVYRGKQQVMALGVVTLPLISKTWMKFPVILGFGPVQL